MEEVLPSGLPPAFILFTHHSYAQMVRVLRRTAARCSRVARTYSIGRSFDGKELLVIEFSGRPGQHELSTRPSPWAPRGEAWALARVWERLRACLAWAAAARVQGSNHSP